jgi:hypothetical protein
MCSILTSMPIWWLKPQQSIRLLLHLSNVQHSDKHAQMVTTSTKNHCLNCIMSLQQPQKYHATPSPQHQFSHVQAHKPSIDHQQTHFWGYSVAVCSSKRELPWLREKKRASLDTTKQQECGCVHLRRSGDTRHSGKEKCSTAPSGDAS